MTYWICEEKGELHVQNGFEWGNDISYRHDDAEWGTYCPLSDAEHEARGYRELGREEAEVLSGIDLSEYEEIEAS